ncbi:MAG: response regulator [Chitinophagaceae bacterium]|nr:response regulator [Chitinophagaceae bacterium]
MISDIVPVNVVSEMNDPGAGMVSMELYEWYKTIVEPLYSVNEETLFTDIARIVTGRLPGITLGMICFTATGETMACSETGKACDNVKYTLSENDGVGIVQKLYKLPLYGKCINEPFFSLKPLEQLRFGALKQVNYSVIKNIDRIQAVLLIGGSKSFSTPGQLAHFLASISLMFENALLHKAAVENASSVVAGEQDPGKYLANLSHQLLTPLNSIMGYSCLLNCECLNDKQSEYLQLIKLSGSKLKSVISEFIDTQVFKHIGLVNEESEVSVPETIKWVREQFESIAAAKDLLLHIYLSPALPKNIFIDGRILNKIISHIALYVIGSTGAEEVELFFNNLMALTKGEGMLEIKSAIQKKAVFDECFISSLKVMATAMNSKLQSSKIQIVGNLLSIHLPFKYQVPLATNMVYEDDNDNSLVETKCLVVEDNMQNARLLKQLLTKKNIRTDYAENGKIALQLIEENEYDYVLMDLHMPVMGGLETIKNLRKRTDLKAALPAIVLTADITPGTKTNCLKAGFNKFMTKPFAPEELFKNIKDLNEAKTMVPIETAEMIAECETVAPVVVISSNDEKLNFEYLKSFSRGDSEFEKELLESSLLEMSHKMIELQQCVLQGNNHEIMQHAHSLKSLSTIVGSDRLYKCFTLMETDHGENRVCTTSHAQLETANFYWLRVEAELHDILNNWPLF